MWRIMTITTAALLCVSCGGGIDSYEDAIDAQAEVMEEMIGVLEGVDDEASAKKASGKIEELGTRLGEIAKQVQALPAPTPEEMQEIAQKQMAQSQEFQRNAQSQMMKLAQYPSLMEAWMRAMQNM